MNKVSLRASDKVRAAAAKLGYVAPLAAEDVPMEVRAKLAERCGVSRQLVVKALASEIGTRPGPKELAKQGKARKVIEAEKVVLWLRALARERGDSDVLLEAADGIWRGHVDAWTDPRNGKTLLP